METRIRKHGEHVPVKAHLLAGDAALLFSAERRAHPVAAVGTAPAAQGNHAATERADQQ